jgi:hypothetical protein
VHWRVGRALRAPALAPGAALVVAHRRRTARLIRLPLDPNDPGEPVTLTVELPAAEAWELMHYCRGMSWSDTLIHCPRDDQARALLSAAAKVAAALHAVRQARTKP